MKSINFIHFSVLVVIFTCTSSTLLAQGIERWAGANDVNNHYHINDANHIQGSPDISGLLFTGTSTNSNVPGGTLNDIFAVDTDLDTSESILSANGVWGATADPENQRILFTQASGLLNPGEGGDNLFALPYSGGTPVFLGRIVTDLAEGLRVDGLAMRNGVLYGYTAFTSEDRGMWSIDLDSLLATQISTTSDSISGLDADPDSCIIYGVNDTTGRVVTLDTSGVITDLVAYPIGFTDIDGIAVANGYAYLVTDEAQDISVLNLSTLTYETALTSPFANADTFSGAAFAQVLTPASELIFKNGFEFNSCADIQ